MSALSTIAKVAGGGPSGDEVKSNMDYLQGPNISNYQSGSNAVTAMGQPIRGQQQQDAATGLIAQTAAGNGPSLARNVMQSGLTSANNAIAAQAMTNMGNTGGGVSQRNLLNAQASANNNYINAAGNASVAEQMGAQSNYANAANAMAQTSLGARGQQLGAFQLQGQQGQAYDQGLQNLGTQKANIGLQATNADAKQLGALGQVGGNIIGGGVAAVSSDEACKTAKEQGPSVSGKVDAFLKGYQDSAANSVQPAAPGAPSGPTMLAGGQGIMEGGGGGTQDFGGFNSSRLGQMGGMSSAVQDYHAKAKLAQQPPQMAGPGVSMGSMPGAAGGMGYAQPMAMMGAPGMATMLSDERCKMAMQEPSHQQMHGFMSAMDPSTFKYKDQSYSPGTHLGVMAQDVDDSKLGADMVQEQGGIKQINVPKALGASLASLAYLNERLDKLEGKNRGQSASA